MKDIEKMEYVEQFVSEVQKARASLRLLLPDIYKMRWADVKNDPEFEKKLPDLATKYITETCDSCLMVLVEGYTKEDYVAINLAHNELIFPIEKVCISMQPQFTIGDEFIDMVASSIVWKMLNK